MAVRWDAARRCWDLGTVDLFFHEAASVFAYIRPAYALKIISAEDRAGRWLPADSLDISWRNGTRRDSVVPMSVR